MDTDHFTIHVKPEDCKADLTEDVETRFDTSKHELERLLKGKNKKVIGPMKNELVGKIMSESVELRTKAYSHLINDGSENKKAKGTKYVL